MPQEILEIVQSCLAGESIAMTRLIERFQHQVFGLCFRMLGDRQDAEDVAQETFLRVFKHLHGWDTSRDFEPWLLAIAGNRCRTHLSSRKRRPEPTELTDQIPDRAPDIQAFNQLAEEIELALCELRAEYRQAFLLFHEHEKSYADIGQIMNCPLGTVKTWVHRARNEVVEKLARRGIVRDQRHELRKF